MRSGSNTTGNTLKTVVGASLLSAALIWPAYAYAQDESAPKATGGANCPMGADTSAMQQAMGTMMNNVDGMMKGMRDPAMKERLQKMHEQMAAMMVNMQKMGAMSGMMGGQQPGNTTPGKPDAAPAQRP